MNENNSLPEHPNQTGGAASACLRRGNPSLRTWLRCPSKSSGYTLIETLVTLALLSTLAIASVGIINSLTKEGIDSARDRLSRRDVYRLASVLRADSTRTVNVTLGDLNWPVTLTHESSKTVYDWNESEDSLSLTETAGQKTVRSERFVLPKGSKPQMAAAATRLTLRVNLPSENNSWIIEGNLKQGDTGK
jgi:prepilin-type N-terminal cleavage/methylation domain-containing protein